MGSEAVAEGQKSMKSISAHGGPRATPREGDGAQEAKPIGEANLVRGSKAADDPFQGLSKRPIKPVSTKQLPPSPAGFFLV